MANYDSNYEIAQEISRRIGTSPVPFDSVYSIALAIYQELGGTEENFDSVYSILLEILPLVDGGIASKVIDDGIVSLNKTWSSSKINTELSGKQNTLTAGENITISGNTISANVPQLEAGENISIEDGKINADGYFYDKTNKSFSECEITYAGFVRSAPVSAMGITDLKFTGEANTTTYTYSGSDSAMIDSYGSMLIQGGYGFGITNGNYGIIISVDAANHTITFDTTLDSTNVLSNEPATTIWQKITIYISGSANTTTYTYNDTTGQNMQIILQQHSPENGLWLKVGDFDYKQVVSADTSSHTITFDSTLDSNNAISNAVCTGYKYLNGSFAYGNKSHAEGRSSIASGDSSHAEGGYTIAQGAHSHVEGYKTQVLGSATGFAGHAEGSNTIVQNYAEHAEGTCNVSHQHSTTASDGLNTIHSIGIGLTNNRKNAVEVLYNGDMYINGVGGYVGVNTKTQDATIKTVQEVINGKADAYQVATNAEIDAMFA